MTDESRVESLSAERVQGESALPTPARLARTGVESTVVQGRWIAPIPVPPVGNVDVSASPTPALGAEMCDRTTVSDPGTVASVPRLIDLLLADKRSENTRRAYRADLNDFFRTQYGGEPTIERMGALLALGTERMAFALATYKGDLIARGLAEATVNRRLAAVQSLLALARRVGATEADVSGLVRGEKVVSYRDTAGISTAQARALLQRPDRTSVRGKRDYALLLLLLENALRSAEVRRLTVSDFVLEDRLLRILGKGRGTQKENVTVNAHTAIAIQDYLAASPHGADRTALLFQNVDPARQGEGLSGWGLQLIVRGYARQAGIDRTVSPHRLRHTAITAALTATGGDVVQVQQLSRHARIETVVRYNDNRAGHQARVTALLGAAFDSTDEHDELRESDV